MIDDAKHFILTADIDPDPNLPGNEIFDKVIIAPAIHSDTDGAQGVPSTGVSDGDRGAAASPRIGGMPRWGH